MTVNHSRSMSESLNTGTYEGKYRFRRPNTEVIPGDGDQTVQKNRAGLHPYWNYGFINSEESNKVNPGK